MTAPLATNQTVVDGVAFPAFIALCAPLGYAALGLPVDFDLVSTRMCARKRHGTDGVQA